MNIKRLIGAVLSVFLFVFFYEWILHGIIIQPIYEETASMWRKPEDCIFPALSGGQFLMTFFLCLLYFRCTRAACLKEGAIFGLLVGLFAASPNLIMYAVQPLPEKLVALWIVGAVVEMTIAGSLLGLIYRPVAESIATEQPATE